MIYFCSQFQFQRTFESLKNVSNKSDLQKTYQKLGKELENLDYLAFKRQQVGVRTLFGGGDGHFRLPAVLPVRFKWAWGHLPAHVQGRNRLCCAMLMCRVHLISCSIRHGHYFQMCTLGVSTCVLIPLLKKTPGL